MIGQMVIVIALPGFNALGSYLTPIFLFFSHFLYRFSIFNVIEGVGDIDDTVFLWEKLFRDRSDHHAPIKSRCFKGMPAPWVSAKLLELRRDQDFHRRKVLSSNSQYHWGMYRKLRN